MQNRKVFGTKRLAVNGMLLALAVITLFFATALPTGRLSLYALSSFYTAVLVLEYGVGNGWVFYVASGLLSLLLVPNKPGVVPYIVFFGFYGLLKYYVERWNRPIPEYLAKLAYFNLCLAAALLLIRQLLLGSLAVSIPLWGLIAVLQAVFLVYDYVYTLFIQYYQNRLKGLLRL